LKINECFPFKEYKKGQKEIIDELQTNLYTKKYFILENPPGSGKSAIAYSWGTALYHNKHSAYLSGRLTGEEFRIYNSQKGPKVLILTANKNLQMQYSRDFKIPTIWSSKDYDCAFFEKEADVHYNGPFCLLDACPKYDKCEYLKAKYIFNDSNIGVTNYHYYLTYSHLTPIFLICDEAHNIEKILEDINSFELDFNSMQRLIEQIKKVIPHPIKKIGFPLAIRKLMEKVYSHKEEDLDKIIISELLNVIPIIQKQIEALNEVKDAIKITKINKKKKNNNNNDKEVLVDDYKNSLKNKIMRLIIRLENITKKIGQIHDVAREEKIIVSKKDSSFSIKPIINLKNTKSKLKSQIIEKILFMSATIGKEFIETMNIPEDKTIYLRGGNNIPKENRKFYFIPKYKFVYQNKDHAIEMATKCIDNILDKVICNGKLQKKGIIHSVSYANAEYILKNSKYSNFLIIPNTQQLRNIRETMQDDIILVSPIMLEGLDLPYDLSRFQIFIKVPFLNLQDRWTKTKAELYPKWYLRSAAISIVQGSGRSIRHEDDSATTFMFDSNFGRLKEFLPEWFKETIITIKK